MTTRTRILKAAEELFKERGYHATTLREVAERVGITKPALYYHFESKSEILANLLNPMTTELEQVLKKAAAAGDLPAVRRMLLTGWLDVFLRSRGALLALFRDLAAMPPALYHRLLVVLEQAITLGAGPAAKTADQVAMAQAISAITDPVALVPHISTEELREHLLTGVWRLISEPADPATDPTEPPSAKPRPEHSTQPTPSTSPTSSNHLASQPPAPARHPANQTTDHSHTERRPAPVSNPAGSTTQTAHGRSEQASSAPPLEDSAQPASSALPLESSAQPATATSRNRGGRPKALSPAEAAQIRELHASGEHTADSIAALIGVSRATIYRYLKT